MGTRLYEYLRLAYNSTLDFSAGYTVASLNDEFFSSKWFHGSNLKTNKEESEGTSLFSLGIRIWLQLMITALVGSEVRNLLFPEEALDGFHMVLFVFGIVQQPEFLKRLKQFKKEVMGLVNGQGGSGGMLPLKPPVSKNSPALD